VSTSKTSEQTQTQSIDPALQAESAAMMNLFRILAGRKPEQYQGVNVAAFTPDQKAAFKARDGIKGYRTADFMQKPSESYRNAMDRFYRKAGKPTGASSGFDTGGGGKK
jgi:hypothetical protein